MGAETHLYRSGLWIRLYRFSVNLKGGPALPVDEICEMAAESVLIGVSLKVVAPTGQYDPTKLINWGTNRWAFKPEIRLFPTLGGQWVLDAYRSVVLTTNPEFCSHNSTFRAPGHNPKSNVAAFEGHLSYDFKPRLWVSLDGNFWYGGETSLNGVQNPKTVRGDELPDRGDSRNSHLETSVSENQLQHWRVHHVRRKLPECLSCVAVFLGWLAEVKIRIGGGPKCRQLGCQHSKTV